MPHQHIRDPRIKQWKSTFGDMMDEKSLSTPVGSRPGVSCTYGFQPVVVVKVGPDASLIELIFGSEVEFSHTHGVLLRHGLGKGCHITLVQWRLIIRGLPGVSEPLKKKMKQGHIKSCASASI